MKINVTVRHLSNNYKIELDLSDKLEVLKNRIFELLNIEPTQQVLTYNDRLLTEDYRELTELGFCDGSTVFLKKRVTVKGDIKNADNGASMMKNPIFRNFLKNPDSMKNMLEMFPGLKEEMDENAELRQMMNDSHMQESLASMSENPNMMTEHMKNFDLVVSKLENMPGGFNMINSMMKDVQTPLSSILEDSIKGVNKYKEGKKIDSPIVEPIPAPYKRESGSLLVKYRQKLAFLRVMGFDNTKENLSALIACDGDLDSSIAFLNKTRKNE